MEKWKHYTIEGNRLFTLGKFEEAIANYKLAKERAEKLFPVWHDIEQSTAALLVSYHNLAELYAQNGQRSLSFTELKQAHYFLVNALTLVDANSQRENTIQRGINQAKLAILDFMQQHRVKPTGKTLRLKPNTRTH